MLEPALATEVGDASPPKKGVNRRAIAVRVVAVLAVVQIAVGLWFLANSFDRPAPESWGFRGYQAIISTALLVLGVLVATRRPGNVIGWIFLTTALIGSLQMVAGEYSLYSLLVAGGPDDLANWGSLIDGAIWPPLVVLLSVGLFSTFPDGQLPSPRWRWILVVAGVGAAMVLITTGLTPTINSTTASAFHNPIGITGQDAILSALNGLGLVIMVATMFVALAALIRRLRRAEGTERKQLEWVTAASAIVPVSFFIYGPFPSKLTETLVVVSLMAIPAAAGVAILRYRLYDIDLIISRTLVYVPLTAFLAGLYSASVALFQKVFQAVTGDRSDAAIIISALVLAAVFTPAKTWLQAKVDRRFKPDADPDRRLRAFSQEVSTSVYRVDPERLSRRLVAQIRLATRAESVSLVLHIGEQTIQERTGDPAAEASPDALRLPIGVRGAEGELVLGRRPSGRPYAKSELMALGEAAEAVATAIADSIEVSPVRGAPRLEAAETA